MTLDSQTAPILDEAPRSESCTATSQPAVQHFRQIVLWPLQIMHDQGVRRIKPERLLQSLAPGLWERVEDEFGNKDEPLHERHYREFVSFLPHVQRFLYGDANQTARQGRKWRRPVAYLPPPRRPGGAAHPPPGCCPHHLQHCPYRSALFP